MRKKEEKKSAEIKKDNSFNVAAGFDFNTDDEQEVQKVQEVREVQEIRSKRKVFYGKTQGKKGMKLKRINMAFGDDEYNFITKESRRQGMSATAFVNMIIEDYMQKSAN